MNLSEGKIYEIIAVKVKRKKQQPKSGTCSDWNSNWGKIRMAGVRFHLVLPSNTSTRFFPQNIIWNITIDLVSILELSVK